MIRMFDIVISNAKIIDGTGAAPYPGHIGIKSDRILKIDTAIPLPGDRIIDAKGMVTAPGFVDVHGHSDYFLLLNPLAESKVRQGVTTEIGGNCGYSSAPIFGKESDERKDEYKEQFSLDLSWNTLQEYNTTLERIGVSINFAPLIGHNTIRASLMGKENREPSEKELENMCNAVEDGMRDGAFGLSTGLIYPPACFSKKDEMIALNAVVQRYNGVFTTHIRSEDDRVVEAIDEVIEIAKEARVPLQISHLKTSRERNWNKLEKMFALIEKAREKGANITCDRYPYVASNTGLQSVLPRWAYEGDRDARIERLKNRGFQDKMRKEIEEKHPEPSYWDTIVISTVTLEKNMVYEGMTIAEASNMAKEEPFDFLIDILIEEKTNVSAIYFTMSEENLIKIYKKPYTMIGSDAACRANYGPLAKGKPHPRAFGTFPRVLGRYVRDHKVMDLPTAVRKMTSDPCRKMGILKRGELREGFFADLVIFNSDTIKDTATFSEPIRYPIGIDYVIVNGCITIEKGQHTGCKRGKILRKG